MRAPRSAGCRVERILWRVLVLAMVGLVLVVVTAVVLEVYAVKYPEKALLIESGEVKADAIIVLGGGPDDRPQRAAELYHQGAAPKIIVSGTGDGDLYVRTLTAQGVPASAILREPTSASTMQNALYTMPLLRQLHASSAIIVTSWYHSRRAVACFRHAGPWITFYSRPAYVGFLRKDWHNKGIEGYVRWEEIKLPVYWVLYGVWPF
jgi:uncharacterized SAM-binding protein YcdF (DUF218 family)